MIMNDDKLGVVARTFLLAVLSALAAVAILPYASAFPSLIIEDDGFFYAEIARNISALGVSTFDGLHETSGYHLLWMAEIGRAHV